MDCRYERGMPEINPHLLPQAIKLFTGDKERRELQKLR